MNFIRFCKIFCGFFFVGISSAICQIENISQKHFLEKDTTFNPKRLLPISIASGSIVAVGTTYLITAWYKNTQQTNFHWFNDWSEWKQMDKVGHATTAFQFCRAANEMLEWSGCSKKTQIIASSTIGFGLMLPIEILDGFSDKWGASCFDLSANATGVAIHLLNKTIFHDNRMNLKVSFHDSPYAAGHPNELGKGMTRYVKDYNGQTYWITCRIKPFLKQNSKANKILPAWLIPAIGYGAEGLIGGYGKDPRNEINAREYRQWYVSFDIDLSAIKVKNPWLKMLLGTVNFIHLPMPAIEFNRNGVFFRPIYF